MANRVLFKEAEDEQKKMGINSALHIIIFDELDAICRTRGTLSGSTGVHDTVVNQLLAKVSKSVQSPTPHMSFLIFSCIYSTCTSLYILYMHVSNLHYHM